MSELKILIIIANLPFSHVRMHLSMDFQLARIKKQ